MEDSTVATLTHSRRVDVLLMELMWEVGLRVGQHDASKLEDPEKHTFDVYSPMLRDCTYGSPEYWGYLEAMKPALEHHYANNRHHPEHFENGVSGMTLVDLIEMLADWKAATERHADGDLEKSLEIQRERFGLSDQLVSILRNTAVEAGWI